MEESGSLQKKNQKSKVKCKGRSDQGYSLSSSLPLRASCPSLNEARHDYYWCLLCTVVEVFCKSEVEPASSYLYGTCIPQRVIHAGKVLLVNKAVQ